MSKRNKIRADQRLVELDLAESRARAQALIMAGCVFNGEHRIAKPGAQLSTDTALELRGGRDHPWASRGGLKLVHGLTAFG